MNWYTFFNINEENQVKTLMLKPDTASDTSFVISGKLLDVTVVQFPHL